MTRDQGTQALLREIAQRGLRLTLAGPDLRLQGPREKVDPTLVARIRAAKAGLIAALSPAPGAPAGTAAAEGTGTGTGTEDTRGAPLTLLQRGFLIGRGDAVEIGRVASHIYHEIDGCWDTGRLEAALSQVVARHAALRTWFTPSGRQVTEPAVDVRIGRLDLRSEPPQAQRDRLAELRAERSHRVLPAGRAPLLAADVTLLAGDRMRLHVGHDGLVMDGISMFLFFREWHEIYSGNDGAAGPALDLGRYVAAIDAMTDRAPGQRSRAYWLDRLDELPPRPALPLAASPAAITRPRFAQHTIRLGAGPWAAVKARAAGAGLTPAAVLMAAYARVLARWGGGHRFTLATTVTQRPPVQPGIGAAIGNFSQTLLAQIDLDQGQDFASQARALQGRLRRDLDHRHYSGIEVLRELRRRDPGADARMPVTFNSAIGYSPGPGAPAADGSALELFGPEVYTSSQTPQVWLNGFAFEQHGGVVVQLDEVTGLFPDGLITAVAGACQALLDTLAADEASWDTARPLPLPTDQRRQRAIANDTGGDVGFDLGAMLAGLAGRDPASPAVLTASGVLTYGELNRQARRAARWLRDRGAGRDRLTGLVLRRGPEQITGIVAALLAGGAYLPVDAGLPAARIAYLLRDGEVSSVLTNTGWAPEPGQDIAVLSLPALESPAPGPAGPEPIMGQADAAEPTASGADQRGRETAGRPEPDLPALAGASPDDLAYVLYTSGTTGEPKGVMVSRRSAANIVADCNRRFGVTGADRFFGISAFNFDLSVYDVLGALSAGAAVVLPDHDRAADPAHWLELCQRFGVTIWNSVPAIAGLLAESAGPADDRLAALRLVLLSGDRIPPALPGLLRQRGPKAVQVSLGGPTETTIWNISHPISPADERGETAIPYGRPTAGNRAFILDPDGLDAPDWVTGEICAAGTGLARGYWRDPARTASRFWDDQERGQRLYRTGDLGRYRPDGTIEIAGRADFQIKVNGYRIEAGEVETRLAAIPAVKQAVVVRQTASRGSGARGDRLVAHLVAAGDERPGTDAIRSALRQYLPDYMTPAAVIWHDALPLTRNGKLDRGRLTETVTDDPAAGTGGGTGPEGGGRPLEGEAEHAVAAMWAAVLQVPADGMSAGTSFYDLGGDSLAAARVFTAIRKRFGVGITLDRLYEVRTVAAMAACITAGTASSTTGGAA